MNQFEQVRKSQLNNSSSKSTYGFGKEQRFKLTNRPLCQNYYNIATKLGQDIKFERKSCFQSRNPNKSSKPFTIKKAFSKSLHNSFLGPGYYNHEPIVHEKGKYHLSQYANCRVANIKISRPNKQRKQEKVPGPGHYESRQNINGIGNYFNSKYSGSKCRTFGHAKKNQILKKQKNSQPGPGHYNYFSEFGCR